MNDPTDSTIRSGLPKARRRLVFAGAVTGLLPPLVEIVGFTFGMSLVAVPFSLLIAGAILTARRRTRPFGVGLVAGSVFGLLLLVLFAFARWFVDPTVVF